MKSKHRVFLNCWVLGVGVGIDLVLGEAYCGCWLWVDIHFLAFLFILVCRFKG